MVNFNIDILGYVLITFDKAPLIHCIPKPNYPLFIRVWCAVNMSAVGRFFCKFFVELQILTYYLYGFSLIIEIKIVSPDERSI